MIENIDKLIFVLRKSDNKSLLPRDLVDKLAKRSSLPQIEVRACLLELRNRGWIQSADWDERGIPLAKLFVQLPAEPLKPYETRWRDAIEASGSTEEEVNALSQVAKAIKDMPADEMLDLIKGLKRLKEDQSSLRGQRLFEVSSRYLLGSSKLLKVLPNRSLIEFGINIDVLSGPPRYVKVAGSKNPKATILVENPHSFESAVLADEDEAFCWISAEGYGLSKQSEEFGDQLMSLVESRREVITLSRRREFVEFQVALERGRDRLYFWGDLDLAGLDIYGRLKTVLPSIQLSPLYAPMVVTLKNGGGHSYAGVQKEGQTLGNFPYEEIKNLAPLCETKGVDQESVFLTPGLLFQLHQIGKSI